jgi:hypothetical protein
MSLTSVQSSSLLFSKDSIANELDYFNKSRRHKDIGTSHHNHDSRTINDEILYYNDQQQLIQLKKQISFQNIQKYQNQLFQQDIFQTISLYLMENPILSYDRFLVLKDISPDNIKKYFTAKVFLHLSPNAETTSIKSDDFIK